MRGVPSHSPQLAATSHLLISKVMIRVRSERRADSLAAVGATSHLLISKVRIRVRSERRAISLAAVSGYVSPADK